MDQKEGATVTHCKRFAAVAVAERKWQKKEKKKETNKQTTKDKRNNTYKNIRRRKDREKGKYTKGKQEVSPAHSFSGEQEKQPLVSKKRRQTPT